MSEQDVPCPDPNQVVTRSILQEVLADYPTKEDLRDELERFATKEDLERFATKEDLERFATKDDLEATKKDLAKLDHKVDTHFGALFERLNALETFVRTLPAEFARQARAISEEARGWVKALDDKYKDLPDRVAQLESQSNE